MVRRRRMTATAPTHKQRWWSLSREWPLGLAADVSSSVGLAATANPPKDVMACKRDLACEGHGFETGHAKSHQSESTSHCAIAFHQGFAKGQGGGKQSIVDARRGGIEHVLRWWSWLRGVGRACRVVSLHDRQGRNASSALVAVRLGRAA